MLDREQNNNENNRSGGIQVIARAAAIMRALGGRSQGLSLGAIAQQVGLPRSTVQRIVGALEAERLVEAVGPGGGFRLGPELGRLIYQTQIDIISAVRPLLEELSVTLNESVVLCGVEKDQVIVIDRIVAERELRVVFPVGVIHIPMHTTASGKALLAKMSDDEVMKLLPDPLPSNTAKTRDRASLLAELQEIRASGVASEYEAQFQGVASFAVPVNTYFGHFAVAAVLPVSRAKQSAEAISRSLLECKQSIEQRIGGKPPTL